MFSGSEESILFLPLAPILLSNSYLSLVLFPFDPFYETLKTDLLTCAAWVQITAVSLIHGGSWAHSIHYLTSVFLPGKGDCLDIPHRALLGLLLVSPLKLCKQHGEMLATIAMTYFLR